MKHLFAFLALALVGIYVACERTTTPPDYGFPSWMAEPPAAVSQRTPAPKIYMRLTNMVQANGITKYDAEFRSDHPGIRLDGMNVRIWIQASQFGWVGMTDFAPGYAATPPNPAQVATGNANSGPAIFGFPGSARYVNGSMTLVNPSAPAVPLTQWAKLFAVQFSGTPACPIVILDKEVNPAAGGFYMNDGITIVARTNGGMLHNTDEYVEYIGWQQTSNTMPFGAPVPCE